jgi:cysteinyl-tRNA synthetase
VIDAVEKKFGKVDETNQTIDEEFNSAMDDDFNTALAISNLFGYFKNVKAKLASGDKSAAADVNALRKTYSLIGLFNEKAEEVISAFNAKNKEEVPEEVKAIAEERWTARLNKDWAKSDELRDKLATLGYLVKDSKEGYTLSKK